MSFCGCGAGSRGAVFFVALICMILLVCDDILPTTLPFLLISAFTTNLYDSYDLFIPYIRYAPAAVICLLFHFIRYRQPMKTGESAYGILAVSVAVMLGGIGRFSIMDYVRGAYYVLGLGFGMLAVYFLMRSQFSVKRNYDLRQRFSVIMTLLGLLCAFIIASGYYKRFHNIPTSYALGFSRNNISTLLMFAMPFPLFLALKRPLDGSFVACVLRRNRRHHIAGRTSLRDDGGSFLLCVLDIFGRKTNSSHRALSRLSGNYFPVFQKNYFRRHLRQIARGRGNYGRGAL